MSPDHVIGVDGGASKTVAIVATAPDGQVVGAGRSGNADIYQTPDAETHVKSAIAAALSDAGIDASRISAVTLSLVGADWPEDFDHWRSRRAALGFGDLPSDRFSVLNDGIGGLESLPEPGPVIAVICGTGAAVSARGPDGDHWHSSFWQRTQGSAELAEKALDAVYLADLGIGPRTLLTDLALKHFSVPDVTSLLHLFTTRRRKGKIKAAGSFTPRLIDAAEAGDPVANLILVDQATALARYGIAAADKVGINPDRPVTLLLTGGVFRSRSHIMRDRIWHIVSARFPKACLIERNTIPVVGAVALSLRLAGHAPGRAEFDRIAASLPDASFFRTDTSQPEFHDED